MIYFELFICYLKIGFFGFGGGYSMLSLIQHEVVIRHAWISSAELSDIIAISQMTPGPIAINSATYIGYTIAGFWGSVIATIAVCLPSLSIMVLITQFFLRLKNSNYMERVMIAMRPSVMGMIAAASMLLLFPDDAQGASMIDVWSWLLFAVAFFASLARFSPIKLIVLSAFAGIAIYYLPEVIAPNSATEEKPINIWRGYDLSSCEVISSDEFEQQWVDYLYMLQGKNPKVATQQLEVTLNRSLSNPEALEALFELCEKYLYNPNSPIRSDELFIPALEAVINAPMIDTLLKIRPRALLEIANRNRLGSVAADFEIGSSERLHQIESPYTLLYFFDDGCTDCKRVSEILEGSTLLNELISENRIRVVKIDSLDNNSLDTLFDLKAIPTLYLLNSEKRVLLKDVSIEQILESLKIINNETHDTL